MGSRDRIVRKFVLCFFFLCSLTAAMAQGNTKVPGTPQLRSLASVKRMKKSHLVSICFLFENAGAPLCLCGVIDFGA